MRKLTNGMRSVIKMCREILVSIYCSFTLCLALFTHYINIRRMKKNFLKEVVFELKFERGIQFPPAKIMEKGIRYTQYGNKENKETCRFWTVRTSHLTRVQGKRKRMEEKVGKVDWDKLKDLHGQVQIFVSNLICIKGH